MNLKTNFIQLYLYNKNIYQIIYKIKNFLMKFLENKKDV